MTVRRLTGHISLAAIFTLSCFFVASGQPQIAQKYALIIGVTGYPAFEEGKRLKFADDDAEKFSTFIMTPEGGSFRRDNIRLLTNDGAKRSDILRAITWLGNRVTNRDLVYVFFAGHGILDNGQVYLMPYDADPTLPVDRGLLAADFVYMIGTQVNAKHMVFVHRCMPLRRCY